MRPGFGIRVALVLVGCWCLLLIVSFLSGLSEPQPRSVLARIGLLSILLLPSTALFWFLFRKVVAHSRVTAINTSALDAARAKQEVFASAVRAAAMNEPIAAIVQGGSGLALSPNEVVLLSCRSDALVLSNVIKRENIVLPFKDLRAIEINGPGTVTQNAGVVGGGFGLQGALKGILVASVLNSLTSKTSTNTFLRIGSRGSEVHLHITTHEPRTLRLSLSPAFVAIDSAP